MKKQPRIRMNVLILLAVTYFGVTLSATPMEIDLGYSASLADSMRGQVAKMFATTVQQMTHGEIEIIISSYDSSRYLIHFAQEEENLIALIPARSFVDVVPEMRIYELPQFADQIDCTDGDYDDPCCEVDGCTCPTSKIREEVLSRTNFHLLASLNDGYRILVTDKPIKRPEDLSGMRISVFRNSLLVPYLEKFHAIPTGESGHNDGQETSLKNFFLNRYKGGLRDLSFMLYTEEVMLLVISNWLWESLPSDQQAAIQQAAQQVKTESRKLMEQETRDMVESLTAEGMTMSDFDADAFHEATVDITRESLNRICPSCVNTPTLPVCPNNCERCNEED